MWPFNHLNYFSSHVFSLLNSDLIFFRLIKWAVLLMSWIQLTSQLRRPPSLWRRLVGRLVLFSFPYLNAARCPFIFCKLLIWIIFLETKIYLFQVATDKCIMLFLLLIVCGVIAIIVVKVLSSLSHLSIAVYFLPTRVMRQLYDFINSFILLWNV